MTSPGEENLRTAAHLERAVAIVLRTGVSVSCVLLVAGTLRTLTERAARHAAAAAVPGLRHGQLRQAGWPVYRGIGGVVAAAFHGRGPGIVMLGVLLLVATPVARVAVSVIAYVVERDRRFVVITALVLAVLVGSFTVG